MSGQIIRPNIKQTQSIAYVTKDPRQSPVKLPVLVQKRSISPNQIILPDKISYYKAGIKPSPSPKKFDKNKTLQNHLSIMNRSERSLMKFGPPIVQQLKRLIGASSPARADLYYEQPQIKEMEKLTTTQ